MLIASEFRGASQSWKQVSAVIARESQAQGITVAEVIKATAAAGITWPLDDDVTNEDIQEILYPGKYAFASPYTVLRILRYPARVRI
jgi:hypothetical protein